MTDPLHCKFTVTHEWVRPKGDKITVGISEDAQRQLSDIIHVELPEPDEHHHYAEHEEMGVVESLRLSTDFHAPVSGTITAINANLLSSPELINEDPYGEGWLVEMVPDDMDDVESLMDIDEYEGILPEDEEE